VVFCYASKQHQLLGVALGIERRSDVLVCADKSQGQNREPGAKAHSRACRKIPSGILPEGKSGAVSANPRSVRGFCFLPPLFLRVGAALVFLFGKPPKIATIYTFGAWLKW